ncbi:purine-cytosine permease FCY22 [Colletotrichum nymphaeae SA-01]|uniref:Purine-cytosine permease FCY22 n=1 Tax=Colletotrichum nymphaeae SA-01 TaxID=1460502 RepID=A0A135T2Y2_9PEZI|nr:purine-cytosine permease FCY22 [Colletotrichum nymphaeae SA-01]
MIGPAGGLSKFDSIVLSSKLFGKIAVKGYTITLNLQLLLSTFSRRSANISCDAYVPMMTEVASLVDIRDIADFIESLETFVPLIGYGSVAFLNVDRSARRPPLIPWRQLRKAGGAASLRATVRVKVGLNGGKAYLVDSFPSRLSRGALDGGCSQDMDGETGAPVAKITPVFSFATSFR